VNKSFNFYVNTRMKLWYFHNIPTDQIATISPLQSQAPWDAHNNNYIFFNALLCANFHSNYHLHSYFWHFHEYFVACLFFFNLRHVYKYFFLCLNIYIKVKFICILFWKRNKFKKYIYKNNFSFHCILKFNKNSFL